MIDRQKYFPVSLFLFILLAISLCVNYTLYKELTLERETHYWISSAEYEQIRDEIKRLEQLPLGVK